MDQRQSTERDHRLRRGGEMLPFVRSRPAFHPSIGGPFCRVCVLEVVIMHQDMAMLPGDVLGLFPVCDRPSDHGWFVGSVIGIWIPFMPVS